MDPEYELDLEVGTLLIYYVEYYVIEVDLEMGAKCNVCNMRPYHTPLKYRMIRFRMIPVHFYYLNKYFIIFNSS